MRSLSLRRFPLVFLAMLATRTGLASGYIVGNGDDGSDLEGGVLIASGVLSETRTKAASRIRRLDTDTIPHLGMLLPELEKSDMYLVNRDVGARLKSDHGAEGRSGGSEVFARTFAEPHASTRFFPAALTLNEEQMIALHVHEALHRALPAAVREDEQIVTEITLALNAPDTSVDRIKQVVAREIDDRSTQMPAGRIERPAKTEIAAQLSDQDLASSVTYTYTSFFLPRGSSSQYPLDSLQSLSTMFYPLLPIGGGSRAVGLGMDFSYVKTPQEAFMGPLVLMARVGVATVNDYDVTAFTNVSLNTAAGDEIKNSPLGRDVTTIGISIRRDEALYYVEDSLGVSLEGEAKRTVGSETENYHYGKVLAATIRAGAKFKKFELGGFSEILLADSFKTSSSDPTTATDDAGRFRIIAVGPEASYTRGLLRLTASARWVVNSTPGVSLDDIGDLVGWGLGQGSISASASLRF